MFRSLEPREVERALSASFRQDFPAGAIVQLEGQPSRAYVILVSGRADAVLTQEDGREILLRILRPGDSFGATALSDALASPWTIRTAEVSEFVFIPRDRIVALMRENVAFAMDLLSLVARSLLDVQTRLRSLLASGGSEKILCYLRELAEIGDPATGGRHLGEKIGHQVIADACGLSRETVTRLVGRLCRQGRLERTTAGWWIPDAAPLGKKTGRR